MPKYKIRDKNKAVDYLADKYDLSMDEARSLFNGFSQKERGRVIKKMEEG